ncbi:L,D-transpeptidase family protein [Microvirga sp. TS319]|uniref:L,D-transpeptidase family protein n=1 Tax=Microvirga sp. TS319 TaxID=3241165 RepID=UPI00351A3C89
MRVLVCVAFGLLCMTGSVAASSRDLTMEAVNEASDPSASTENDVSPILIKAQVLLDRARFSPGVIDGRNGENVQNAIKAFERAHELDADGKLDEALLAKLNETSSDPVLMSYTIAGDDVKGPFTAIPERMEDQAKLERLSYSSPEELLAEKFHMDIDLLKELNPGKRFDKAGETIVVANVASPDGEKDRPKAERVEVIKNEHSVRVLGKDGAVLAVYPASIGSEEKPAPTGSFTVRAVAHNPVYTYNPDYGFKGVKAKEKFEIKPGPNNPVGTVWIDLSIESYGIHGTPEPEKVGKAYSHGCVRLTNWDAEDLAGMVKKGTPVDFLD